MNRINQLFNSNKKDILSIYFCAYGIFAKT